ncbi:methylated-DNA--[protein]-cysteine S-methyltransferase [Moraxella sp. ZJ142]|uniref:methylated-DNA--[protein]-cysteine S-methyltransferase n=1 Tax=Moraxella marmotae TaxID=3344520 RepID=UPI0035D4BBC8
MISTHYHSPYNLPAMRLTAKDGRLLIADWFEQKTTKLIDKLSADTCLIKRHLLDAHDADQAALLKVCQQLDEYFVGTRQVFDIALDLSHGTAFQQSVWQALRQIPYGQTISYAQLAKNIGKPTAFRACANANGKNLISLIIPCHRVIAANGSLGGYTGGVQIKETLLNHEAKYHPL